MTGMKTAVLRLAVLCLLAVLAAAPVAAETATETPTQDNAKPKVTRINGHYAGELVVPVNKSQVIQLNVPYQRVAVSNPEIADIMPLTGQTIYILGKSIGLTNLSLYDGEDRPIAVVDISVSPDVQGLKARLYDLFPDERIEVRPVNDGVILSGTVSGTQVVSQAMMVAERYAPEKVANLMSVRGSQQVMLAVRFAELKRNAARELGVNLDVLVDSANFDFTFLSLTDALVGTAFKSVLSGGNDDFQIDAFIDALEAKGVLKTLAEPNLIALSGDTASFLAGGEFPIPICQDSDADGCKVTVEFKPFGVGLAFTPTIVGGDLINLMVNPEVSAIDEANAIELNDFVIPSFVTRRAKTTVELRDGQSFAIAGLLQSNYANSVEQYPWLGDVPVLGALFRSSEFQRDETELVIIVTAHLVQPAEPAALALPSDRFTPPTDVDLFYRGHTEHTLGSSDESGPATPSPTAASAGGVAGSYGHIIE